MGVTDIDVVGDIGDMGDFEVVQLSGRVGSGGPAGDRNRYGQSGIRDL
jgi:hypothetical protein